MVAYLHLGLVYTWCMSVPIDIVDESASLSPEQSEWESLATAHTEVYLVLSERFCSVELSQYRDDSSLIYIYPFLPHRL